MEILNLNEDKKQEILNSALKEFSIKGYDSASTNIIAKEAGISKGLLFHYVKSKEELFLFLVDYCMDKINQEYINQMDFNEHDIFKKLRYSYLLQVKLLKKHPWIFDFIKLSKESKSHVINKKMNEKDNQKQLLCFNSFFEDINESKFRPELNIESCKQLIFWGNIGFTNELLDKIKNLDYKSIDYEAINKMIDEYFDALENVFYIQ